MKKILKLLSNIFNILYKILPFFIGMYCYYPVFIEQEEHIYPFLDAVYSSIKFRLHGKRHSCRRTFTACTFSRACGNSQHTYKRF